MVACARAEDLLHEDVERLIDLSFRRRRYGLLELLQLGQAVELHGLHGNDGATDVRLQVFFCDFGLGGAVEERVKQGQLLVFGALGDD